VQHFVDNYSGAPVYFREAGEVLVNKLQTRVSKSAQRFPTKFGKGAGIPEFCAEKDGRRKRRGRKTF